MTVVSDVVGLSVPGTTFALVALMWLAVAVAAWLARHQIWRMGATAEEAERLELDVSWWHLFNPRYYVLWRAWAEKLCAAKDAQMAKGGRI